MNIHCLWQDDTRLVIKSLNIIVGYVEEVCDEPVLTLDNPSNRSLTFSEIEHVIDNWYNMPKPIVQKK